MIEEFFKTEREAINLKLKTFFDDLNKTETEVLFAVLKVVVIMRL